MLKTKSVFHRGEERIHFSTMGIKRFYKRTRNLFQRLFSRSIDVWPFASIIAFILSPALSSYVAGLALQTYTRGVVPQHEIAVTMKLIAVNVTSKKGDVISDLIESEFVIYDNGKKMDIAAFENYVDVSRTNNECDMPARIGEAGLRKRFMLTQKYLFFFDFAFNNLQGIKKAKEAAAYFINASDQVPAEYSVISFYPLRGLVINEYATKDRSRTLRTIQTLDPGEVVGGAEEIEEEYVRLLTRAERANVAEHMRDSLERSASKRMVSDYLRAVTDLAKAVRYMPGDKNLFLLSSGIPSSIIYGLGAVSGDIGDSVLRRLGEEMAKELSSANCRVFAFNTTQMGTDLFRGDAERLEHGEADVIKPPAVADSARDRRISGESILRGVSQVTGGIYFGNITGYPKSMELIYELTRSYYVLGYRVDEKWDGRYHSLRIEVKRRGCKVRAQTGYFSSKRFADYTNLERKLHLIDLALSPDISAQPAGAFPIRILSYDVGRKPYLFALSSIPETTIYRFRTNPVEIISLIFDEKERLVHLDRRVTDFAEFGDMDLFFATSVELSPSAFLYRLVIRDLNTGDSAVASARYITSEDYSTIRFHSPLLLIRGTRAIYLEGTSANRNPTCLWPDIYPFDRVNWSPIVGEVKREVPEILAIIPFSYDVEERPIVRIEASLIDSTTEAELATRCSVLNATFNNGLGIQYLRIVFDSIGPGTYFLEFRAREDITSTAFHTKIRFVIDTDMR